MKSFCYLLLTLLIPIHWTFAADPLEVAPNNYKLLFENEKVRVMEVTFKPGDKIKPHSHPEHFVVVTQPGKLKISKPDGSVNEMELSKEQVVWIPSETHWSENTGKSTVELIVTEMKG